MSFNGWATGDGSSNSSSHSYSDSDYYSSWSSSGCDYGCGCDSSCGYSDDYSENGYDSSSNASYNYAALWSWNIDGTKSYSLSNDVTGHYDDSCYYNYNYTSYSSDSSCGCDCSYGYGCHYSSDDDYYCCSPSPDYSDTVDYTGWSIKGGQASLPSTFNVRWTPFNGGIHDENSCGYGCGYGYSCGCGCGNYSYNGASFSAPNFSVTMYDESYDGEEYESNEVWHKGRSIYGSGGYLYSGNALTSHIQNTSVTPTAPSTSGNTSMPDAPVVYAGNPNFNNFAFIDTYAIIDAKYTKLEEPVMPEPVMQQETPKPPAIVSPAPRSWVGFFSDTRKSVVSGIGTVVSVLTAPVTEVVHNVSTVYDNMRSSGNGRIKSAVVAVTAQAARSTGVENLSYAWDDTDPVTGEQCSGGWRATYAVLGASELVVSALGIKAASEAAIGSVKGHPFEGAFKLFYTNMLRKFCHLIIILKPNPIHNFLIIPDLGEVCILGRKEP